MILMLFMLTQLDYTIFTLMLGSIDGNKYVNGIIFALAGVVACIFTGPALNYYKDIMVFKSSILVSAICNLCFFYFESPNLKYLFLFITVCSIAGAFNTMFVIMELRIPPENIGSASVLMYVVGALGCTLAPSAAATPQDTRMVIYSGIALIGLVWSCFLPTPGKYLPKAVNLT